jgi:signal transduction histidine kinase
MKIVLQALVLIFSFVFVFVWKETPLVNYTVALSGVLIVGYILLSARKKGKGFINMGGEGPWGIFFLNTVILLLIFSTGGIDSVLFFLLYFLGFGIAFVFEPMLIFVFVLGVILIFVPDAIKGDLLVNSLKLGSLLLISPLAFFFGIEYRKNDKEDEAIEALEERTKEAADTISEDIEEVIKDEKANLKSEDMEKLNEILEETEDLREESKE